MGWLVSLHDKGALKLKALDISMQVSFHAGTDSRTPQQCGMQRSVSTSCSRASSRWQSISKIIVAWQVT